MKYNRPKKKPTAIVEAIKVSVIDFDRKFFNALNFAQLPLWLQRALDEKLITHANPQEPTDHSYLLMAPTATEGEFRACLIKSGDWIVCAHGKKIYSFSEKNFHKHHERISVFGGLFKPFYKI